MTASIVLILHLLGYVGAEKAAAVLFVMGVMLLLSEALFTSGIIAFNGLLTLYVGYSLKYGQSQIFGYPFGWEVVFGIAFVELAVLFLFIAMVLRYRRLRSVSGAEGMIGHNAYIVEWSGNKGRVRLQGEIWAARSEHTMDLKKDDTVTVDAVDNLTLKIKA